MAKKKKCTCPVAWIAARARKIRKKNKGMTQREAIKRASFAYRDHFYASKKKQQHG